MAHRPLGPLPMPSLAALGVWLGTRLDARRGFWAWLIAQLLEERERWFLWLPVALGSGVALYFSLPIEPSPALGPILLLMITAAAWLVLRHGPPGSMPLWLGLGAVALGLSVASLRTQLVSAPVLERRGAYMLDGRVLLVEERVRGQRLLLDQPRIEDIEAAATPLRVRVSRRDGEPPVIAGDRVRMRAMLMPPSPPGAPHGFDFARHAFFEQLGAVGYALGDVQRIEQAHQWTWQLGLARLRQHIAGTIAAAVPGDPGAVATALLTGLRGAIPEHVWHDMQVAGIAHLLAISGLHLGLVAGTLFFAVRFALALSPPLALRLPTKKIAAALALAGAFVYLLLTGMTVPTQRAFTMTALMLIAVMADRNPFSMRLVAWAALVVLLFEPESLLGASFQMSFAAVVGLIAVYETGVGQRPDRAAGLDRRFALYVGGVALTTLIASAATAPFAIYHFGRLPTYGVIGNLIAVPLTAFWIMPMGLLGLILLPVGLGGVCFMLMGQGVELILAVAGTIAQWPGAALHLAQPPIAALIATIAGGLWLCLWRRPWRRLGLLGIALGVGLMVLARPPDLLVDRRGQIVAVRLDDGRLAISPWRRDRWITGGWLRSAGQDEAAPWPEDGAGDEDLRCDALGCVVGRLGQRIALARRPEALEEDCALVDLVISYPRIEHCPNGTPLIGPNALWHAGGLALWVGRDGIETTSVREVRGERPWVQADR
jgi:competence protein ComEC